MIAVYLLGHRVGDINEPVIYVSHKAYDYNGNEVTHGLAPILFFTDGNVAFLGESVMVNLAPGMYIARAGSETLKFSVK